MKFYQSFLLAVASSLLVIACGGSASETASVASEFSVKGVKGTISGENVTLDLSSLGNCAVDVKSMVVTINANGYQISPDPTTARDYSTPVNFTLTAPDGSKAVYKVTVTGAACLSDSSISTPTPTPTTCTAAPINPAEPYSLVFKGCDENNVATYYDKTECVRQNSTNLIWQGQLPSGTNELRGNDRFLTNFYDDSTAQQKFDQTAGIFVPATAEEIHGSYNSLGFKNEVNASRLCGSDAWRLPGKDELLGLVKTSETPKIDNAWFPNTPLNGVYWTSSFFGTDTRSYIEYAFAIDFNRGLDIAGNRDSHDSIGQYLVRLVH